MNNEQTTTTQEKPTLGQLWQDIKKHKKLYYKVLGITFIASAIITLSIPNYYKCTVMLAPELSGNSGSSNTLSSLASSFGIKLGTGTNGSEALFPTLYPDLMNSVAFRSSLFSIKVKQEDDSTSTEMLYYDYLRDFQKRPWWSEGFRIVSSFFLEDEGGDTINPFQLTKEQFEVVKDMEKIVICDVDKETLVITINVIDQDPLIAATIADSVKVRLQKFITDYRTRKARVDLENNQKLYVEAKTNYEKARLKSAAFNDAHRKAIFDNIRSEKTKLENELQLKYQAYSQITAQLQLSEAKVQEYTPAFTELQPASVPVKKSGPKRTLICIATLFLSFVFTSIYIFYQKGYVIFDPFADNG